MYMNEIVEKLNKATEAYDAGHPIMSDKDWDDLYFILQAVEKQTGEVLPDSPTNRIHFETVSELKKVKHSHPMLSLAKTKDIEEVKKFCSANEVLSMCKMDGLTCSLTYIKGELVRAETRGNGEIGEDITHNAKVIPSIPNSLGEFKRNIVVDGEVICTYSDFEQFSGDYKNPRNFASGSIRLLESEECSKRKLTFVAWDIVEGSTGKLSSDLDLLSCLGFVSVPRSEEQCNFDNIFETLKCEAEILSYPIDGCVVKYNDKEFYSSLGSTDHHFRGGLAYKFYDETVTSHIIDIEWTMGKTGVLTPVAVFEPVEIDGTTVQKASLHNLSIMDETLGKPYQGQEIEVFKANMIIPQIYSAVKQDSDNVIENPKVCPICGSELVEEWKSNGVGTLSCGNPNCESKFLNLLDHFVSKQGMDIDGMSLSTLEKLVEWGYIHNFKDIYNLKQFKEQWVTKEGFSDLSVTKLLDAIEKSKNCKLQNFISAFSIPTVGLKYATLICEHFNFVVDKFFEAALSHNYDFTKISGIGSVMNENLQKYCYTEMVELAKIMTFDTDEIKTQGILTGKVFVITGKLTLFKNRDELVQFIKNNGGTVADSVNTKTTYLINNDSTSESSKNKKAKQLGITIITENDFKELING